MPRVSSTFSATKVFTERSLNALTHAPNVRIDRQRVPCRPDQRAERFPMQMRPRWMSLAVTLTAVVLGACGGGDGEYGPDPLPTPASPAAGTVGDGRLPELIEWARDAQEIPAMGAIIIRGGQVVERA